MKRKFAKENLQQIWPVFLVILLRLVYYHIEVLGDEEKNNRSDYYELHPIC